MTTTSQIKSGNPEIKLTIKEQTTRRVVSDLTTIKPQTIQDAARLALTTRNAVQVLSIAGQAHGKPSMTEIPLADRNIGDGRMLIQHLGEQRFQITAQQITDATVYKNGSAAHSWRAVHRDGKWAVELR